MTKKILLLVAVLVCTISSNSYALFSYNYDTKLDKHVQLINDYLRMKPHNETLLIKALAKKVMQVYSPEKEKEIYYYNQIISRIDRKSPVTCKQEPYVSDGRKSLETYLQNKRYEVKTNSCMIWGEKGDKVACSLGVFDTQKYAQGQKYIATLQGLGINSIEDLAVKDIINKYSYVRNYSFDCSINDSSPYRTTMGGDDTKIKSLDTIIKHIGYINQNKRSQVDPSLFLSVLSPKDAHASLIDKKVLKNGILLLTASGNEGVGVHMRYLSKKGNTISAVKGGDMFRYQIIDNKSVGLYEYKSLQDNSYATKANAHIVVTSTSKNPSDRILDNKSRQYVIDIFRGKKQSIIFNQGLQELSIN